MQKMQVQQTILATLRSDLPTYCPELVTSNQDKSRQALGKLICSKFKLLNTKGRPRISGFMKALYVLEEEGHVSLPSLRRLPLFVVRVYWRKVFQPRLTFPQMCGRFRIWRFFWSRSSQARAIWNTLLAREHPKGTTTFAGARGAVFDSEYLGAVGSFPPRHCI